MFFPRLGHYHAPSTISIMHLQIAICNENFGSKLHFVWSQNKVQFCHKMPQFTKFSGSDISRPPLREGRPPRAPIPSTVFCASSPVRRHPNYSNYPRLSETFRGLWQWQCDCYVSSNEWAVQTAWDILSHLMIPVANCAHPLSAVVLKLLLVCLLLLAAGAKRL